jgi:Ca2+-binding EF-hand superfamily protein
MSTIPPPPPIPPPRPPTIPRQTTSLSSSSLLSTKTVTSTSPSAAKKVPRPPGMRRRSITKNSIETSVVATPKPPPPKPGTLSKKKKNGANKRRISFADQCGFPIVSGPTPSPEKKTVNISNSPSSLSSSTTSPPTAPTTPTTPSLSPPPPPKLSPPPKTFAELKQLVEVGEEDNEDNEGDNEPKNAKNIKSMKELPSRSIPATPTTTSTILPPPLPSTSSKTSSAPTKIDTPPGLHSIHKIPETTSSQQISIRRRFIETVESATHQKYHDDRMKKLAKEGKIIPRNIKSEGARKRRNTMLGLKEGTEVLQSRFQLEKEQKTKLENIFHLLDKDMDGYLQEDQLLTALTTVGINPTRRIKFEIQKRLPRRKNSKSQPQGINFETFSRIIRSILIAQPTSVTEIDAVTKMFEDPEKPGTIKGHELRHLLEGVQTSSQTQLSVNETDLIFQSLGIMEDADVNVHQYVDVVSDGFIRVVQHRRVGDNYRKKIKKGKMLKT